MLPNEVAQNCQDRCHWSTCIAPLCHGGAEGADSQTVSRRSAQLGALPESGDECGGRVEYGLYVGGDRADQTRGAADRRRGFKASFSLTLPAYQRLRPLFFPGQGRDESGRIATTQETGRR